MTALGLVFILGICFGSFLNVCIYRIPQGQSVAWPPSSCPNCNVRIQWRDNIPLLSWLFLGARCRACKQPISAAYPAIELLTALLFSALWLMYGWSGFTPIYALATFGLLLGTFIDLKYLILPDCVTISGILLFPMLSALFPPLHGAEAWQGGLMASLIGLAAGIGLFWTIRKLGAVAFKKEAMGLGDVKLMGGLGALLGWQAVIYITFFSSLAGAVIGTGFIIIKKKERSCPIPYGPYIALAALSWMFGGYRLWETYLAFMGF